MGELRQFLNWLLRNTALRGITSSTRFSLSLSLHGRNMRRFFLIEIKKRKNLVKISIIVSSLFLEKTTITINSYRRKKTRQQLSIRSELRLLQLENDGKWKEILFCLQKSLTSSQRRPRRGWSRQQVDEVSWSRFSADS